MSTPMAERLLRIANEVAATIPDFLEAKGPGPGNKATNAFMRDLRVRATELLAGDFAEKKICGKSAFAVDVYFADEAVILEVALGLGKPNSEYEKDILKAVMAKELGNPVKHLFFVSKPGATSRCLQPGRVAIKAWAERLHGISIRIHELGIP